MAGMAPHHAHAVMHCNLNTADLAASENFYRIVAGREPRFRYVGIGQDATMMGLAESTSSVTAFVWDERGPRAAPALELVEWSDPVTVSAGTEDRSGFSALGYRVPDLSAFTSTLGQLGRVVVDELEFRDRVVPAVVLTDPDGVRVEVVEVGGAGLERSGPVLAYERIRVTDLARSIEWYESIGFESAHVGAGVASLALPEDPTFSLEFTEDPGLSPASAQANEQGLYRIALAVEDVAEAASSLQARDPSSTPDPVFIPMVDTPTGGYTVIFLSDPDGTVCELVSRPRAEVHRPMTPI